MQRTDEQECRSCGDEIICGADGYCSPCWQDMFGVQDEDKVEMANGIFEALDIEKDEYYNKIKQRDEYIDDKDIYAILCFILLVVCVLL
jgi:hypothetical protein